MSKKKPYSLGNNPANETAEKVANYIIADLRVKLREDEAGQSLCNDIANAITCALKESAIAAISSVEKSNSPFYNSCSSTEKSVKNQTVYPITPNELRVTSIPNEVINVFNSLISEKYRNGKAVVNQKDVVKKLGELGFTPQKIEADKLLDIEEVYEKAGWIVGYDKPGFNELGETFFIFEKK